MIKLKKNILISICIILSVIVSKIDGKIFITDPGQLLPFLFTILGLCITAYTFIYTPICELLKDNTNYYIKKKLDKLLKSYEEDMMLIFILSITIILSDIICNIDIPFFKDVQIKSLNIISMKMMVCNFFISLSAMLAFYALYDLINATFKILRKSFEKQ